MTRLRRLKLRVKSSPHVRCALGFVSAFSAHEMLAASLRSYDYVYPPGEPACRHCFFMMCMLAALAVSAMACMLDTWCQHPLPSRELQPSCLWCYVASAAMQILFIPYLTHDAGKDAMPYVVMATLAGCGYAFLNHVDAVYRRRPA